MDLKFGLQINYFNRKSNVYFNNVKEATQYYHDSYNFDGIAGIFQYRGVDIVVPDGYSISDSADYINAIISVTDLYKAMQDAVCMLKQMNSDIDDDELDEEFDFDSKFDFEVECVYVNDEDDDEFEYTDMYDDDDLCRSYIEYEVCECGKCGRDNLPDSRSSYGKSSINFSYE